MLIETAFDIGQTVYLITDPEQAKRLITAFIIRDMGRSVTYELSCGAQVSNHYAFEITSEANPVFGS